MSGTTDCLSLNIENLLSALPLSSKPSIFRVRDDLRSTNEKLYDPEILSVGPLHHGKDHLKKMEQFKLRYLKLLLKRINSNVHMYVTEVRSMQEEARRCYEDPIEFNSDQFVQMMLLDGIFIIELIRNFRIPKSEEKRDRIPWNEHVLSQLRHDLILIENQIPFFVLNSLFNMTKTEDPGDNIRDLFQSFIFNPSKPPTDDEKRKRLLPADNKIYHLVGLLHDILCSSFPETKGSFQQKQEAMLTINCVTELQEAGVKFINSTKELILKIEFTDDRELKMPCFYVYDGSESFLRNIIAYEKSFKDDKSKYFTDYIFLMQCLINSAKDVKELRHGGIIANLLGDDEMVYSMFNRFGKNIASPSHFCYDDVFTEVNACYNSRWNKWKANLRNNYFNGPWKTIAFFASLMLLLFTLTQTIFSVISYTNPATPTTA